jgi:hypothetical protein
MYRRKRNASHRAHTRSRARRATAHRRQRVFRLLSRAPCRTTFRGRLRHQRRLHRPRQRRLRRLRLPESARRLRPKSRAHVRCPEHRNVRRQLQPHSRPIADLLSTRSHEICVPHSRPPHDQLPIHLQPQLSIRLQHRAQTRLRRNLLHVHVHLHRYTLRRPQPARLRALHPSVRPLPPAPTQTWRQHGRRFST